MKINNEMKRLLFTLILTVLFLKISAQDRFTDLRDGNSYRTVTIEGVTWMAENLKYKAKGSGTYYFDNNPDNSNESLS
jgi:hypothetical protein